MAKYIVLRRLYSLGAKKYIEPGATVEFDESDPEILKLVEQLLKNRRIILKETKAPKNNK